MCLGLRLNDILDVSASRAAVEWGVYTVLQDCWLADRPPAALPRRWGSRQRRAACRSVRARVARGSTMLRHGRVGMGWLTSLTSHRRVCSVSARGILHRRIVVSRWSSLSYRLRRAESTGHIQGLEHVKLWGSRNIIVVFMAPLESQEGTLYYMLSSQL